MRKFERITSTLEVRQFELEEILDLLHKDLKLNEIKPLIVEGHCNQCP